MIVVLAIIAALTHLAVRELTKFGEARLTAAADRQLEEIREAALSFYADMGRLVNATNGTLSELWIKPKDAVENKVIVTNAIRIVGGWKGPYLKLPAGKTTLRDPWGNEFKTDNTEFVRLSVSNEWATAIAHYGPDSLAADRRAVSLLPRGGALGRTVYVTLAGSETLTATSGAAYQSRAKGVEKLTVNGFGFNRQLEIKDVTVPGKLVITWTEGAVQRLCEVAFKENESVKTVDLK